MGRRLTANRYPAESCVTTQGPAQLTVIDATIAAALNANILAIFIASSPLVSCN
jgi:hypothetical protein